MRSVSNSVSEGMAFTVVSQWVLSFQNFNHPTAYPQIIKRNIKKTFDQLLLIQCRYYFVVLTRPEDKIKMMHNNKQLQTHSPPTTHHSYCLPFENLDW